MNDVCSLSVKNFFSIYLLAVMMISVWIHLKERESERNHWQMKEQKKRGNERPWRTEKENRNHCDKSVRWKSYHRLLDKVKKSNVVTVWRWCIYSFIFESTSFFLFFIARITNHDENVSGYVMYEYVREELQKYSCWVFLFACLDDAVNSTMRSMKPCTVSIQENGSNDRDTPIPRKQSLLDEKALREDDTKSVRDQRIQKMSRSYRVILESIGEDPLRQGKSSCFHLSSPHTSLSLRITQNTESCSWSTYNLHQYANEKSFFSLTFFRHWFSLQKVTNNPFVMSLVMLFSMKTVKIWWWWKKSTFILSANIICIWVIGSILIKTNMRLPFLKGALLWQSFRGLFTR